MRQVRYTWYDGAVARLLCKPASWEVPPRWQPHTLGTGTGPGPPLRPRPTRCCCWSLGLQAAQASRGITGLPWPACPASGAASLPPHDNSTVLPPPTPPACSPCRPVPRSSVRGTSTRGPAGAPASPAVGAWQAHDAALSDAVRGNCQRGGRRPKDFAGRRSRPPVMKVIQGDPGSARDVRDAPGTTACCGFA